MSFTLNEEQEQLVEEADKLGRTEFASRASHWDQTKTYPFENIKILQEAGYLGLTIPEQFGGAERPLIDAILVIEQISKYCGSTGRILVETNMGILSV